MTQYVFTLTSRMVAIASACIVLLGILLFLLGVEVGRLWIASPSTSRTSEPVRTPLPLERASSDAAESSVQPGTGKAAP